MNTTTKISIRKTLNAVMMIFMIGWASHAFADSKQIYAKWNFVPDGYPSITIQKKVENLTANEGEQLVMVVDATIGKLSDNSGKSRAQINKGTKLRVPVVSGKDVVEVNVANDTGNNRACYYFTINGDQMTSPTVSHKATADEVDKGYVEIEAAGYDGSSSNTYIYYVSVTQYPPVFEEKTLYSTDFTEWEKVNASDPETTVDKKTTDGQTLTFHLFQTNATPDGTNSSKFKEPATTGFLQSKDGIKEAYIKTSTLKSVTTISFVHCATGNNRGWGLKVKGDGDADWVTLSDAVASPAAGKKVEIDVNRKNVQLWFYSLDQNSGKSAFMTELKIDGLVQVAEEVKVSYYDTDGTTLIGEETVNGNTDLKYKYGADDVTTHGDVFRGWFDGTDDIATKVYEGTKLLTDISLYAKATPMEEAHSGTEYTYDMTKRYWYAEDHDLIDIDGGAYLDKHGWLFENDGTIKLHVASTAQIDLQLCNQSQNGTITITDEGGGEITSFSAKAGDDGIVHAISYSGSPTTLTLNIPAGTYIHGMTLYNYKPVYVSFNFPNDKTEGKCPDMIKANSKNEVTLPDNTLFSRSGWTFQGWTDGTNVYEGGKTHIINETVTLVPRTTENKYAMTDTNTPVSVTWPFDHRKAPAMSLNKAADVFVFNKQTSVEGEKQDIALKIDTSNGKIDNQDNRINQLGNEAEGAQINTGTKLTVSAVYGMTVIIHGSDKEDDVNANTTAHFGDASNDSRISIDGYTIADEDKTISDNGKTLSIVYRGDDTSININFDWAGTTNNWGFYKDITVVYPVLPFIFSENAIEDADPQKYPNEKAENAGTVDIQSTSSYPNTGKRHKKGDVVRIIATPNYGYDLKGYRVKGTTDLLSTTDVTDEAGVTHTVTDFTVGDGVTTVEAIFTHKTLHKVTVKASDTDLGSVTLSPVVENFYQEIREPDGEDGTKGKLLRIESWFTEGTEVTASAEPAAECVVDYWTEGEAEDAAHLTEANSYTFTTTAEDKTIVVHMKRGEIGSVIFDTSNAHVNGESVASLHRGALSMEIAPIHNVRSFTVPTNYTFFKSVDDNDVNTSNAYHLLYWIDKADNDNRYELGKTYSFKTPKTITLTPVFVANPTTRTNRVNEPLIRYDFGTKVYQYYDSSSKEMRNTCAPTVDIDNNTDTYWTAQAYFEVLTNGVVTPHTRDVTMYVNTGSSGYIRNEGLGDWCAFGPGTTFWCTSSTGTTVTIMSYSKITTTTIDGVVPTLDEKRTAEERERVGNDHAYVYSYTTQNSATTMPIVIGDDYSYYQWIEVNMLAANLVNQQTAVDAEEHGKINDVKSLSNFGGVEMEDGSHSFRMGDRIRISFERLFGFEFDKLVETGKPDDEGNHTTLFKMNDDGTVDMVDDNYVMHHNIPRNADGTWGKETGDDKTVFTLKAIEPTEAEAANGKRTSYELEYDITNHHEMEIVFKEKPTYYVTYNAGSFASGLPPVAQWMEEGDKYTIPRNVTLYYEGNTLDHWVDQDYDESMSAAEKEQHTYRIGSEYKAQARDLQMFPVFYTNEFSILDLDEPSTVTWYFAKRDGAPTINYERTRGVLVSQLKKGDKQIDLKIDLDATAIDSSGKNYGKFNNTSSNERIQVNKWSKVYFPATPECVVRVTSTSGDPSNMMVAGKKKGDNGYNSISANAMEVTCPGDTATHKAVMLGDNTYLANFSVTYKPQEDVAKATILTLTCENDTIDATEIKRQIEQDGYVTFTVSPWKNNGKIPPVTGTATNEGIVTSKEATLFTKETVVTVSTKLGVISEAYPVRFEFATPEEPPVFQKVTINDVEYTDTDNVVQDVPQNGIIKILFDHTMQETTFRIEELNITTTSSAGRELEFRYWDLPEGGELKFTITPDLELFKDIYGLTCQQTLTLTLHVTKSQGTNKHNTFDFVVGKDGTIDDAIRAANESTKPADERYYIFVPDGEYHLTGNDPVAELGNVNNERNIISRANVSLIGQSKSGTTLWNKPTQEGISYTATIRIGKQATEFYSQDLTLENRLDYWGAIGGGAGRAVAFWDQGNKSVMKNVALMSWQDTYYSNNSNADYRGYFETCDLAGVVDFLCGDGDIWLEKCNIILRDRTGNNIAAPSTQSSQQWGYVFNNCTIKSETEHPQQLRGGDYTLGRTWNDSPACTYLYTKMQILPTSDAWGRMGNGGQVIRFHEYHSMNGDGSMQLSLGTRSLAACIPGAGSDNCVINAAQAAQYTLRNVVGGIDAFEPDDLCRQIDAASSATESRDENDVIWNDEIEVDDDQLRWNTDDRALCYFVFKYSEADGRWKYILNTTDNYADINEYGSGYYCVRAANQRGGLGAQTESVLYELRTPYELVIKQLDNTEVDGVAYGWSTICLPFNARVPEEVTVYAATAHNKVTTDDKVEDFIMTLTPVETINNGMGYVVYGPAGKHYFSPTSRTNSTPTILTGNATDQPISTVNKNGYVLSNKAWGLGFYRYTGLNYASYRAWLPQEMVNEVVQEALVNGTRMIRMVIDDTNEISLPNRYDELGNDKLYDLSGKRTTKETPRGIYISPKKGKVVKW